MRKVVKKIVCGLFCSFLFTLPASAQDCFDMAGRDAHIDPDLLRAIAWQESGFHFRAIGPNPGEGYGIGLMQIDSQHLPWMASSYGIHQHQLTNDICVNIYSGAYILALAFNKWGETWEAVGAYNAGFAKTPRQHQRRMQYARKIYTYYWALKKYHAKIASAKQKEADKAKKASTGNAPDNQKNNNSDSRLANNKTALPHSISSPNAPGSPHDASQRDYRYIASLPLPVSAAIGLAASLLVAESAVPVDKTTAPAVK